MSEMERNMRLKKKRQKSISQTIRMSEYDKFIGTMSSGNILNIPNKPARDSSIDSREYLCNNYTSASTFYGTHNNNSPNQETTFEFNKVSVGLFGLFRYATIIERIMICIGVIFAIIEGAGLPLVAVVFGNMSNVLAQAVNSGLILQNKTQGQDYDESMKIYANHTANITDYLWEHPSKATWSIILQSIKPESLGKVSSKPLSMDEFESLMTVFALFYSGIGVIVYISVVIQYWSIQSACEKQVFRIRLKYIASVTRQDMSWFDKHDSGRLSSFLNDDIERIRDGLGEQITMAVKQTSIFVFGFCVGFAVSWQLTTVVLIATPVLGFLSAYTGKLILESVRTEQERYSQASAICEEILSSIRAVLCLNGQKNGFKAYRRELEIIKHNSIKKYYIIGLVVGAGLFILNCTNGVTLYVSTILLSNKLITPGATMSALTSSLLAATGLGAAFPPIQAVLAAISSASIVFGIIDSAPTIDSELTNKDIKLDQVEGNLSFRSVVFSYPTRPLVPVIKNINLQINKGQTLAICGKTGSGKSTIINLLLRFYDPNSGNIYLDNFNIKELNLAWLRSLVGIVEQEPSLFDCSISENIALGTLDDSKRTYDNIVTVAKLAHAHDFISSLPNKYSTICGNRGNQMSGGQKQRIAIARALLSDPKILLLDEATSALDNENEALVQLALNNARKGRTTVIIAHRLSTIRDSDLICFMDNGKIMEFGNHDKLMSLKGFYFSLVTSRILQVGENKKILHHPRVISTMIESDIESDVNSVFHGTIKPLNRSIDRASSISGFGLPNRHFLSKKKDSSSIFLPGYLRNISEDLHDNISGLRRNIINYQTPNTYIGTKSISFAKLYPLIRPEIGWILLSFVASFVSGALNPVYGLFFAQIFDSMIQTSSKENLLATGEFWSLMFLLIACINLIVAFSRIVLMTKFAEENTTRLRLECFGSILRRPISWFDNPQNSPQSLSTRLASDSPLIKSIVNSRMVTLFSSAATIGVALVIAFIISWKLSLLVAMSLPMLFIITIIQSKLTKKLRANYVQQMTAASQVAVEAISHVKLIQALGQQTYFTNKYQECLDKPLAKTLSSLKRSSQTFAISQGALFIVYGASFKFGGYLIATYQLTPVDMFRTFFSIAYTAVALGQLGAIGGDMNRVSEALENIRRLIMTPSQIDNFSTNGIKPRLKGSVAFKNVSFRYPNRQELQTLKGLTFSLPAGCSLGLIGASGSGKSTIVSLLLRFYEPDQGVVKIDSYDVKSINLEHLRRNVCIVSQEPVLFKASIKENILYGLDTQHHTMCEVVRAAKLANIHDFIQGLPDKYDTQVGGRGAQLSGGQKQRVAIARAIIRDPAILILDEATSALDSESEALVSQALDKAIAGKTCIKIAHRLLTIRDCDYIAVVDKGSIVEMGSHKELMCMGQKGYYYKLMLSQEVSQDHDI